MAVINEEHIKFDSLINVAHQMAIAARTAPKGKGKDNILIKIVTDTDIEKIAERMKEIAKETGAAFFERDAYNILSAPVLFLIGTTFGSMGLPKCGMCGFSTCAEKDNHPSYPCAFNTGDLGIAIGSAASVAMDNRVDNRIMYTVGQAVLDLKLFEDDVKIVYGIPLSATSKNPFFDRK